MINPNVEFNAFVSCSAAINKTIEIQNVSPERSWDVFAEREPDAQDYRDVDCTILYICEFFRNSYLNELI